MGDAYFCVGAYKHNVVVLSYPLILVKLIITTAYHTFHYVSDSIRETFFTLVLCIIANQGDMHMCISGCAATDLITTLQDETVVPRRCADEEFVSGLLISDGVVCYNGTTVGSTAVYFCNDDYNLVGDDARVCQSNDNWSGSIPQCNPGMCCTHFSVFPFVGI